MSSSAGPDAFDPVLSRGCTLEEVFDIIADDSMR